MICVNKDKHKVGEQPHKEHEKDTERDLEKAKHSNSEQCEETKRWRKPNTKTDVQKSRKTNAQS